MCIRDRVKAYHTTPITLILSGITAKSLYTAEGYYIKENEDHETDVYKRQTFLRSPTPTARLCISPRPL